uniref:acyltransferase Pun1-like n=1 Tax=Erigeron canadensis TaxID=72917 RepID=UPI001CB92FC0|nr:acyltransferase Pun1-like [Erigeron canadensis]
MGVTPLNPTRFEALSSLLFKCAVDAATTKSGSLQLSNLALLVNMRDKISTICPKTAAGNILALASARMANSGEIQFNEVILVDFGWEKPERVLVVTTGIEGSSHFIFMDTASGDGIEAIVHLEEGEMAILQNHKELLQYVEDN